MIDIVIFIKDINDIDKTLISICMQEIKDKINVIIINSGLNNNLYNKLNIFKEELNIKVVSNDNDLDILSGKYIMFIDSGNIFYNAFSVQYLYYTILENNADLICGMVHEKRRNKTIITNGNENYLYGKIYNKDFLNKHNIKVDYTSLNNNSYFNKLVLSYNPKMYYIEEDICILENI